MLDKIINSNYISIGKQGENNAIRCVFDISEWVKIYGAGMVQLLFQRPNDDSPYPCVVTVIDGLAYWVITNVETSVAGEGSAELQYIVGDTVVKSIKYSTTVYESLAQAGAVPEPQKGWVDSVVAVGAQVSTDKQTVIAASQLTLQAAESVSADKLAVTGMVSDVASAKDRIELAEQRTKDSEIQAGLEADRALNNILNGVSTHNADNMAHSYLINLIRTVEAIARGKATGFTFATKSEMDSWLLDEVNIAKLTKGDNLYIKALNEYDYWWDGEAIQPLETECPDLTNYYTKLQIDALLPLAIEQSDHDLLVQNGTVQAGRIYYVVPDGKLVTADE